MINWSRAILVGLITGISAALLLLNLKRNKNLYEKLNRYFHPDFIIILFVLFFVGHSLGDYLRGENLLWSIYSSSIIFIIFVFIDFLVKKFWKKK